jgi:membrane fusion protein (multidrug efflux system)
MIRYLLSAAIASLIVLHGSAIADEVKGFALVKVQDPKRGSIPELIIAHGVAIPATSATQTASLQRDGMISEIYVEVGDQFKKGDKLLDFGASPAAVVAYKQALTTLSSKTHTWERKQQLFKLQLATRDDVESAEKDKSDAESNVKMLEEIGSIKESEIVEAPFDGVVSAISVSKGDRISAGAPLMTLSRTDRIILSVGVEAGALAKVKPDMPVHLASLLPGRKPSEGKVKRVGVAIDLKTRQVPVFIDIADGAALSGENFRAGIEVGKFQGWIVPRDAVGNGSKGPFIFQIDEGHAKRVLVNVLGSVGKNSIIEGDIDSQKEIVLSGNYQIADGDAVRPEEAAPAEEDEDED